MTPSSQEMLAYVDCVNRKYVEICGKLARKQMANASPGSPPIIGVTGELLRNHKTFRRLIARYAKGDLRHTEQEEGAVEYIARWCIEKWGELAGNVANSGSGFVVNRNELDARKSPPAKINPFAPKRGIIMPDGRII